MAQSTLEVDGVLYEFASPQIELDFLAAHQQDPSIRPEMFGARAVGVVPRMHEVPTPNPWRRVLLQVVALLIFTGGAAFYVSAPASWSVRFLGLFLLTLAAFTVAYRR